MCNISDHFDHPRIDHRCLDHRGVIKPVKRLVGGVHNKNRNEHQHTIFTGTDNSTEQSVRPSEMNSADEAVEQFDLPTDSFVVEIDYELKDNVNGPTDEEFEEINDLVENAISDEYGFCVNDFSWGLYEY